MVKRKTKQRNLMKCAEGRSQRWMFGGGGEHASSGEATNHLGESGGILPIKSSETWFLAFWHEFLH